MYAIKNKKTGKLLSLDICSNSDDYEAHYTLCNWDTGIIFTHSFLNELKTFFEPGYHNSGTQSTPKCDDSLELNYEEYEIVEIEIVVRSI